VKLAIGVIFLGFCQGYFGREAYGEKKVEAFGVDWIVVRGGVRNKLFFGTFDSTEDIHKRVHGESDSKRELVIDRFAKGGLDGFAATLGAGGTGVDGLQHAARHLVLLEESWSPMLVKQAVGRVRRIGQKSTVVLHKLVTGHPVEERVHAVVERKLIYVKAVDEARAPQKFGALW